MKVLFLMTRIYFKLMSMLLPKVAGRQAFTLFQKVHNKKIRHIERPFFSKANHFKVELQGEDLDCYELGNPGDPLVFLIHGWNSNAGSMGAIAFELASRGYHVIAPNLPAHGFHKAKRANFITVKEALQGMIHRVYPDQPFDVVAHSFGSAAITYSLVNSRYRVNNLILLTNPGKFEDILAHFKNILGLGQRAFKELLIYAGEFLKEPVENIDVSQKLKGVDYKNLMLIHDEKDRILPFANSLIAYESLPNTELMTLRKVGHYKMLWNKNVIDTIANFLESKLVNEGHVIIAES